MKHIKQAPSRRPRSSAGAVAKSRKDVAIQLVRLEFDINRVEMAMHQAELRLKVCREEHNALSQRRRALVDKLDK